MKETIESIIDMESELKSNNKIRLKKFDFFSEPANSNQLNELEVAGKIEKSVIEFYRVSDGFNIEWEAGDISFEKNEIRGRVIVNPFPKVLRNWKGVVYFEDEPENTPRRRFFPVDFFADETACGFCSLEGYRNMIYLFRFEGDLIPLYVNFQGYLMLMRMAKACWYWQNLILEIIKGEENIGSSRIKRFLPEIFPDFNFAAFTKLFGELRVK